MNNWTKIIAALTNADPIVLVTVVCVVALLVVGQCVRHLCNAFGTKRNK